MQVKYRVRHNPETNKWDVHEKMMLFIGKLTWTIKKQGFVSKGDAEIFVEEMDS